MPHATPSTQPPEMQPFAVWNRTLGVWETAQLDLSERPEPYSETWPTSGMTCDGSAYPLPLSAHPIRGFASSCLPARLFRTPLASDSSRGRETLDQVRARRGTIALSHQIIDLVLHGPGGSSTSSNGSEALFNLIESMFVGGEATRTLSPDWNTSLAGRLRHPLS